MKTIYYLILILIVPVTSSCTSYYYSILNSNDKVLVKSVTGDFIIDNDSVKIAYNFFGENAPITISVFNKTMEPIYVDWKRSAIIIDSVATSYKGDHYQVSGTAQSNSYGYNNGSRSDYSYSQGTISGSVTIPHDAEFIPPQSKIIHTPLSLADFSFDLIPNSVYRKKAFCKQNGELVQVNTAEFEESDSPLNFKSYLTIYFEKNPAQPVVITNDFYISELMKTGNLLSPNDFAAKQGDVFYVKKVKGATAALITTAVAITVAGTAIDVYTTRKYNE